MIDREKVLTVLHKRFPGASLDQFAAAANAIVGLQDEWEDVTGHEPDLGYHFSVQCSEICYLAAQVQIRIGRLRHSRFLRHRLELFSEPMARIGLP